MNLTPVQTVDGLKNDGIKIKVLISNQQKFGRSGQFGNGRAYHPKHEAMEIDIL